ncbi:MAG: glycosyltransferase [Acidobacteriota bacterium]|nr:glycosyltransferase [Acidobacteriota bacterium]
MTSITTSVIIPNLDSPLVDRTLAALAADGAPGPGVEVLVVGRDAPGLVPRDGSIRFVETAEAVNPAAGRNRGVAEAQGERLLFTDADCAPRAGWRESLCRALNASPVAGGAVTFEDDGNPWALADNIASFHELLEDRPAEHQSQGALGSLNLAATRDAWERVGGFDEELATSEDVDWVLRARTAGLATAFEPRAVVEHGAVRRNRADLVRHATWYGRHFRAFCRRHPGLFGQGPTWKSRRRLALAAPLKSWTTAAAIFHRHPRLRRHLSVLPKVAVFKRAWYRAVLEHWELEPGEDG